jgi:hypothetical protein
LHDGFAARAGFARLYDAIYNKSVWNIFQFLGHIFAQRFEMTIAAATIIARRQHFVMPIPMVRQWLAAVLAGCFGFDDRFGVILGRFTDLFIFLEKPGSADPVLPTSTQIDGGCVHEVGAEAARPSS